MGFPLCTDFDALIGFMKPMCVFLPRSGFTRVVILTQVPVLSLLLGCLFPFPDQNELYWCEHICTGLATVGQQLGFKLSLLCLGADRLGYSILCPCHADLAPGVLTLILAQQAFSRCPFSRNEIYEDLSQPKGHQWGRVDFAFGGSFACSD